MYTNVNGLLSKRLEVEELLEREKPDMLVLSETKWKNEWSVPDIGKGNYDFWIRNRSDKGGGGVMILTSKRIRVEKMEISNNKAEIVKIMVKNSVGKVRSYVGVYVPPLTNAWSRQEHETMLEDTIRELDEIVSQDKDVLIVGDFNCKDINWEDGTCQGGENSWSEKLMSWGIENVMTQWIDCDTRFSGSDTPARLDLLFTSDDEAVKEIRYESPLGKSDHVLMKISLGEEIVIWNEEYKMERYRYNKTNFEEMRKYFEAVDWRRFEEEESIHGKWDVFLGIYSEAVEKYVPKGRRNCKKGKEWYNDKCEKARKGKARTWNRWMKVRTENNWKNYVDARNESVRVMRAEKLNYEKDIMDKCKSDPRLFYSHINGKLKKREGITGLKVEGITYSGEQDMAEVMNKEFQTVFTMEGDFGLTDVVHERRQLREVEVHRSDVMKLMEKLDVKKAPGPDGISNWILRECRDQLVDRIYDLLRLSLLQGKVPKDWKRANIVPIYKGGNRDNPLNYRPVSLTSVVGKMCETIIKEVWMKYLEDNNVLTNCQFGFRRGSSCPANLLSFYSRVIDVVQERNGWVDGVYLDLKKAFDKVPHKRLLWKIRNHGGVGGRLLDWMRDYLSEREMRTLIKNESSSWLRVTSGVPQGSVLGPVMFGIYVNDLVEGIDSHINLFADDAKIMRRVEGVDDCEKLQRDLDKIGEWSRTWQMEFNLNKCKIMEFGRSKRRVHWDYKMGGVSLKKSGEEVDLGVTITESLTPDRHINRITGEVTSLLRRIKMAFSYLDADMMKKLIGSMIRPRLEYAATVWSPHTKKNIRKLERIQRAATKMVPELRDLSYEERLGELGLPTLENRRERGDLISVYKMVNGMDRMGENWRNLGTRNTRGHNKKLKKVQCMRDIKKYSFPHRVVDTWNGLEEDVVNAISVHSFKEKLDKTRYRDGS